MKKQRTSATFFKGEKKMGKQRKTYSESFKRKVAIEAIKMNGNYAEVAAKYDITPSMATIGLQILRVARTQKR